MTLPIPPSVPADIPRVMVASDLPGFGRVALSASIPVLSAMGVQVCPLPTAILSTHGAYPGASFLELGANMRAMLTHWQSLSLTFSALLSGFLGSLAQFQLIEEQAVELKRSSGLVVVDPVLGDHGRLYGHFGPSQVAAMRRLCRSADIITPNLTEAALLLGKPADSRPGTELELKDWLRALADLGPGFVVMTSCPVGCAAAKTSVAAYHGQDQGFWRVEHDQVPLNYPGSGDVFTSVLLGAIVRGGALDAAIAQAVQFTNLAVQASYQKGDDPREGLAFETLLDQVNAPPIRGPRGF